MPKRIQLRRTKGWKKPEGAVVVSRPSKWGNPYRVEGCVNCGLRVVDVRDGQTWDDVDDGDGRALAVEAFAEDLGAGNMSFTVEDVRRELKGKDLCCWCPLPKPGEPDHCHAAVLLEIANS